MTSKELVQKIIEPNGINIVLKIRVRLQFDVGAFITPQIEEGRDYDGRKKLSIAEWYDTLRKRS